MSAHFLVTIEASQAGVCIKKEKEAASTTERSMVSEHIIYSISFFINLGENVYIQRHFVVCLCIRYQPDTLTLEPISKSYIQTNFENALVFCTFSTLTHSTNR